MFLLVSKALLPTFLMTMSNRRGVCRLAGLRDDVPAGRGQSGSVPFQRATQQNTRSSLAGVLSNRTGALSTSEQRSGGSTRDCLGCRVFSDRV
jgi:hypothetical protein